MKIQDYIDENFHARAAGKKAILTLIDFFALSPPAHIANSQEFGCILEGITIARWLPWRGRYNLRTALSEDRLYMVEQFAKTSPKGGAFYECGVYTGGVTRLLLDLDLAPVVAFDTYSGIQSSGVHDLHSDGDYDAGDENSVFEYISGASIVKGRVPDSFKGRENDRISFAHLDMDIYAPTKAALEFIWPRLLPGGAIVLDDYGFWTTPGIKKAAVEFGLGRQIYLSTGQLVITK